MKTILVTSIGGSPATGVVRSLRETDLGLRIVGTDSDPFTLERSEADENHLVPKGREPDYLDRMNDAIRGSRAEFAHCQNSSEMVFFSKFRDQLGAGTFLPSRQSVEVCTDKYLSYVRWAEKGVPVPRTVLLESGQDVERAFREFGAEVWIRKTAGSAGRLALVPKDAAEAVRWIDNCEGWGQFTAAEKLGKDSTTWMSIWKDGELIVAQGRRRHYWEFADRAPAGVTGITGSAEMVDDKVVDEVSISAIRAIDPRPHGIWGVDLTYDSSGAPRVTEINIGRFFTTVLFYTRTGANFPEIFVRCALDLDLPFAPPLVNPCKRGVYWLRGVDFEPKLVPAERIGRHVADLERRRKGV